MKHVVIPFTVKTESVEIVKQIISEFISAIERNESGTLMYRSFQKSDELEKFIHIMTFKDEEAENLHRKSEYCKRFVDKLYPLCTEMPRPSVHNEIK